jgi:hypothetical protein
MAGCLGRVSQLSHQRRVTESLVARALPTSDLDLLASRAGAPESRQPPGRARLAAVTKIPRHGGETLANSSGISSAAA